MLQLPRDVINKRIIQRKAVAKDRDKIAMIHRPKRNGSQAAGSEATKVMLR